MIYTPRQLTPEQPDRCELCPLVGLIPSEDRRKGKRERYYCLGIYEAQTNEDGTPLLDEDGCQVMSFPRLSSRGIRVSAKSVREGGHLWHRPCDMTWHSWTTLPGMVFGIPTTVYNAYRLPYEREQMIRNMPKFNFYGRKRKN